MAERAEVNKINRLVLQTHFQRYHYASKFVKNKRVLDIASGVGYGSDIISKNEPEFIIAGDIYFEGLVYGLKNYSKLIDFLQMEVNFFPLMNSFFDTIISFETIEHVKDPEKFLSEIHRTLKSGGMLVISTPNRIFSEKIKRVGKNPFHEKEYSQEEFVNLLSKKFVEVETYGQEETGSKWIFKYPWLWKAWRLGRPILLPFLKKKKNLNINKLNKKFKVKEFWADAPNMIFVCKKN